jgi:hypothetical protein
LARAVGFGRDDKHLVQLAGSLAGAKPLHVGAVQREVFILRLR